VETAESTLSNALATVDGLREAGSVLDLGPVSPANGLDDGLSPEHPRDDFFD
jgi:hypothetical protein